MCSPSDLTSFSFGDIVSKLKMLFEVVLILFGLMNGGAALGCALDARARADVVRRLRQPEAGFFSPPGDPDCWVWRFTLDPLQDDIDAPSGSAVVLSAILGVPYVRLRAALPDEMVSSALCSAIGRKHVFSLSGMAASLSQQQQLLRDMRRSRRDLARHLASAGAASWSHSGTAKVAAAGDGDDAGADVAVARAATRLDELVGTALVLGFLQAACLMPVVQLAQHRSAARRYFGDDTTPAGRSFDVSCTDFITMLTPGACACCMRLLRARAACACGVRVRHARAASRGKLTLQAARSRIRRTFRHPRHQAQVAASRAHVEAAAEPEHGGLLGGQQHHRVRAGGTRPAGDGQPAADAAGAAEAGAQQRHG